MVYISNTFPYGWIENGTSLRKLGYISAEKLKSLIEENEVITDIDKTTRDVITLFTRVLIGTKQGQGEMRKFKNKDTIVIISIEEDILCAFEVIRQE